MPSWTPIVTATDYEADNVALDRTTSTYRQAAGMFGI